MGINSVVIFPAGVITVRKKITIGVGIHVMVIPQNVREAFVIPIVAPRIQHGQKTEPEPFSAVRCVKTDIP